MGYRFESCLRVQAVEDGTMNNIQIINFQTQEYQTLRIPLMLLICYENSKIEIFARIKNSHAKKYMKKVVTFFTQIIKGHH